MAYEDASTRKKWDHHESVKEQAGHLFGDFSKEVKDEVYEIRSGEPPAQSSRADLFTRQHVMGLILILFGLVALALLIGIAAIAIYGHRSGHSPGMIAGCISQVADGLTVLS